MDTWDKPLDDKYLDICDLLQPVHIAKFYRKFPHSLGYYQYKFAGYFLLTVIFRNDMF